jgi:hypothetical protein
MEMEAIVLQNKQDWERQISLCSLSDAESRPKEKTLNDRIGSAE